MRWKTAILILTILAGRNLFADEGMWLLNAPPRKILEEKYGFMLKDDWLLHAQKAAVRFNNGGSGGFVSAGGLVITNHHVGGDCLQKLNVPGKDYYRDGYYASTQADELKCPDLELNVLQSIEDVTARVESVVRPGMSSEDAAVARRQAMAEIEKQSLDATGLRSDVVTLYQGGLYHLYRTRKYTDVRLVFAPERAIAGFGGDHDNFEFPRYDLDICFFRAYENNAPARIDHYFRWSRSGPMEGELVLVFGFPGTTNRQDTVSHLVYRRDIILPYLLARHRYREAQLLQYSQRGAAEKAAAMRYLYSVGNSRKRDYGSYQGLLDTALFGLKRKDESEFRSEVQSNPKWAAQYGDAWQGVDAALKALSSIDPEYDLLERGDAFDSRIFPFARHLVRLATEKLKPGASRLREYRDSNLESLELQLFSPAPIDAGLERVQLAGSFSFLAEQLGGDHPLVQLVLEGKSPAARAAELLDGTKLYDPAERKRLAEGGIAAVESSTDPMILLARKVDSEARRIRGKYEGEVEEPMRQAYARIARARFEMLGMSVPPDATFTLRMSFGVVKPYREDGVEIPVATTVAGLKAHSARHENRDPFEIPAKWAAAMEKLDPNMPINFISTADTIGGSSGSPVLNREGEFVGINFDRNRHGMVRTFMYTEEQARHISVHSRGILEALRTVYHADRVVQELQ